MKKNALILIILILVSVATVYFAFKGQTPEVTVDEGKTPEVKEEPAKISMCYFYTKPTEIGFEDRAWLRMDLDGERVVGEYHNLPAGKDSKVGGFTGSVGAFDPAISGRRALVTWSALQEGMQTEEELMIDFGEGSAVTFYGEMQETGGNTYLYKDKNNLKPGFQMWQVDCADLAERFSVEKYVRENITKISSDQPVLGATLWFVITTKINTAGDTGEVVYEDGHIQRKAIFDYEFDPVRGTVQVTNFQSKD